MPPILLFYSIFTFFQFKTFLHKIGVSLGIFISTQKQIHYKTGERLIYRIFKKKKKK